MHNKINRLLILFVIFVVIFMSIGYSVLNKELSISGEVNYRPKGDMRITNVKLEDISNANIEYFDFSRKEIKLAYSSSGNAFLKFTVEVTNYSNTEMGILKIDGLDGGVVEGYTFGEKLVGEDNNSKAGMTKEFTITYNSSEVETKSLLLKFDFEEVFTISYKNIVGEYQKEILNSDNLNITLSSPPKDLIITMNGVNIDNYIYDYVTGKLSINNVNGNLVIEPSIPNEPVLSDGMIPVYYDENDKVWKKADSKNGNNNWYNYDNQMWANAVTVTATNRSTYVNGSVGMTIPMEDINTMWVWIPRYSYTIKSEDGKYYFGKRETGRSDMPSKQLPGEIDVKFIGVNDKDTGSAQYTEEKAGNWRTNDAFNFDGVNRSGIWVAKFEVTGDLSPFTPCKNENCDISYITIKPNVPSAQNHSMSSYFYMARSMQKVGNPYGFNSESGELHVLKNDEWGAVAYLSQSKYGKYGNENYSGANKEVYINNSSDCITGNSGGSPIATAASGTTYAYNDMTNLGTGNGFAGPGASTSGSIYGVYDMSGGAWELVMSVLAYDNQTKAPLSGHDEQYNSGFNGYFPNGSSYNLGVNFPPAKYYNMYISNSTPLGHTLTETAGWYGDYYCYADHNNPWFRRGGVYNHATIAGVFHSDLHSGSGAGGFSTHFILTPNN